MIEENNDSIWVSKYRPTTVNDMCLDDSLSKLFNNIVSGKKQMPHVTLAGPRGIGKTTLAHILGNALSEDVKFVKCGNDGSVDDIRNQVREFCLSQSFDGRNKTVILDEADGLSSGTNGSSAQDALRGLIEECEADTRFILTCNYINKIDDPILSRCTPVRLKCSPTDVLKKCIAILDAEKITYTKSAVQTFYEKVILANMPDIRACINVMYLWTDDGVFSETDITTDSEISEFADNIIALCKQKKFVDARKLWMNNEAIFFSYEELGGFIFEKSEDLRDRMTIGKHLVEMSMVLDKEINFTCLMYELFNK